MGNLLCRVVLVRYVHLEFSSSGGVSSLTQSLSSSLLSITNHVDIVSDVGKFCLGIF